MSKSENVFPTKLFVQRQVDGEYTFFTATVDSSELDSEETVAVYDFSQTGVVKDTRELILNKGVGK